MQHIYLKIILLYWWYQLLLIDLISYFLSHFELQRLRGESSGNGFFFSWENALVRIMIQVSSVIKNLRILAIVKEIFLESHHSYYIVHISKNLISDVRNTKVIRLFWSTTRAHIEFNFNEYLRKLME